MSEDNKYTTSDLLNYSAAEKPIEFGDVFSSLLLDRIDAAVDNRKLELSQSMFAAGPEPEDTDEDDDWGDEEEDEEDTGEEE